MHRHAADGRTGKYTPCHKAEELKLAVWRDERQLLVYFEALVPNTRVEGAVVELVRILERQRAVRHASEPAVAINCAIYVACDCESVAATNAGSSS